MAALAPGCSGDLVGYVRIMLVDRDDELAQLADLLAAVGSAGGKVVLVRGEAGIGKTALVRAFSEQQAGVALVVWGFCDNLLTPEPLSPFWDMARADAAVADALARGSRRNLFDTLLELLSRRSQPHVVVIEDMQFTLQCVSSGRVPTAAGARTRKGSRAHGRLRGAKLARSAE